uniref:(California timema) hypothetical protein n=1 Tax=Timema californicum TaxID=61474 RepID=A0A7R9JEF3_TIMCA|nr:unnamed protein product [Timema californicum]
MCSQEVSLNESSTFGVKTSKNENSEDEDSSDEFYFESDHLALKGNKDYLNLLKTVAILEAQRAKAVQAVDELLAAQEVALQDPLKFLESLQKNEHLSVPGPQVIAEVPNIDWSQYDVTFSESSQLSNRKNLCKPSTSGYNELFIKSEPESSDQRSNSKVFVRGRAFDDSKPETFNQLWTMEEQRRLEELLLEYPPEEMESNRWKKIAVALGKYIKYRNRTPKQVCSRVQKYFIKLHKAGLPVPGKPPKITQGEGNKRPYHRHHRNNHFLFRPTTFFPSHKVPVYMSDFDDAPAYNYPNSSAQDDGTDENLSNDDSNNVPESLRCTSEYQQMELLRRVKKEKSGPKSFMKHLGYKCNLCEEEPIVGTRWHCSVCANSVDYCTDCVVSQLNSANPHPLDHHLVVVKRTSRGIWDLDYFPQHSAGYNYLDPNFMPE